MREGDVLRSASQPALRNATADSWNDSGARRRARGVCAPNLTAAANAHSSRLVSNSTSATTSSSVASARVNTSANRRAFRRRPRFAAAAARWKTTTTKPSGRPRPPFSANARSITATPVYKVGTPKEALLVTLNERGGVDLDHMADSARQGCPRSLMPELKGSIFLNPANQPLGNRRPISFRQRAGKARGGRSRGGTWTITVSGKRRGVEAGAAGGFARHGD